MADPDVLNRLEEIERRYAPIPSEFGPMTDSTGFDILWLLRLTRALLESQGELMGHLDLAADFIIGRHQGSIMTTLMKHALARAEKVRKEA